MVITKAFGPEPFADPAGGVAVTEDGREPVASHQRGYVMDDAGQID
jgi:hypothetical protein